MILASLNSLIDFPEANRPVSEVPGHRELVIKFGSGGYVARYHYTFGSDVVVLFVKHQREVV
jgi:plasmid stabilization system protein ParE